jgi:hypothetical protein
MVSFSHFPDLAAILATNRSSVLNSAPMVAISDNSTGITDAGRKPWIKPKRLIERFTNDLKLALDSRAEHGVRSVCCESLPCDVLT